MTSKKKQKLCQFKSSHCFCLCCSRPLRVRLNIKNLAKILIILFCTKLQSLNVQVFPGTISIESRVRIYYNQRQMKVLLQLIYLPIAQPNLLPCFIQLQMKVFICIRHLIFNQKYYFA